MDTKDLEKWFMGLVAGKSASDYKNVLKSLAPALAQHGIGQQHDSSGEPRGRLFLPTNKCPNTAPKSAADKFLGVNQNPECWERVIDVVDDGKWAWIDRGGPEYVPFFEQTEPNPVGLFVPWFAYDENGFQEMKRQLAYDYARRPQGADFDVCVWAARVFHNAYMGPNKSPLGMERGLEKARAEWCAALGVPLVTVPSTWKIGDPV